MDAKTSYREAAVRGASPVRLVICLYEQAIEDLRRAVIAQEKGDIELATRGINHALTVIAQLHGSLDMEHGGDVARNLARFYSLVRAGLTEAQVKQSTEFSNNRFLNWRLFTKLGWRSSTPRGAPTTIRGPAQAGQSVPSRETAFTDWSA